MMPYEDDDLEFSAPDTFALERPSYAAANLLRGDLQGATLSMFAPEALAPSQAVSLAQQWGVDEGVFGAVFKTITNPVVLAAAILGSGYPIGKAANLFKFSNKLAGYEKRIGRIASKLGWFGGNFAGTDAGEAGFAIMRSVDAFKKKGTSIIDDGLAQSIAKANLATTPERARATSYALGLLADGADNPLLFGERVLGVSDNLTPLLTSEGPGSELRRILRPAIDAHERVVGITRKEIIDKVNEQGTAAALKHWDQYNRLQGYAADDAVRIGVIEKNYYPHISSDPVSRLQGIINNAGNLPDSAEAALSEWALMHPEKLVSEAAPTPRSLQPRRDLMIPDPRQVRVVAEQFPGSIDTSMLRQLDEMAARGVPTYTLEYEAAMSDHLHRMASFKAWEVEGHGSKVISDLRRFSDRTSKEYDPLRAELLTKTYIPMLQGRVTQKQAISAQLWGDRLRRMSEYLAPDAQLGGLMRQIAPDMTDKLYKSMFNAQGPLAYSTLFSGASRYLYGAALGGNLWAAALNPMLGLMTGASIMPIEEMVGGLNRVVSRSEIYFKGRAKGLLHQDAFRKASPAFVRTGAELSPTMEEAFNRTLNSAWGISGQAGGGTLEKVERAMMSMFQSTEQFNRLWMFESGRGWAYKEARAAGKSLFAASREANEIGTKVLDWTAFAGGPLNAPAMFADANPLMKQFMTFGTRSADWVLNSSTLLGSAGTGGRNWGNLARMAGTAVLAHNLGEAVGVDLDYGLFPGAIPFRTRGPFAPLPVPPAVGLFGAVASDFLGGKFEETRQFLPLLVPGGVAGAKAFTSLGGYVAPNVAPQVAQLLRRDYVDYGAPAPDGRYAVMSAEGSLIGYSSPLQIAMKATGLGSGGMDATQEREMVKYFTAQRDRIRDYRKRYIEAMIANDVPDAHQIQDEFQQVYKMPLSIKPQDIEAVRLRKLVPRLERMLGSLPKDMREQFAEVLQTSLMADVSGLMGIDPELLRTGTPTSRMPQRAALQQGSTIGTAGTGMGGIGARPPMIQGSPLEGAVGRISPRHSQRPHIQAFESFSAFD